MALDCLDGLVGLAARDCPCVSGGQPSGYNDSSTGYYLDDWEHGFPVMESLYANVDCGEDTIWDRLAEARSNGIRDVKSDLLQSLRAIREDRVVNWNGLIGKTDNVGSYITGSSKVGIQLRPRLRMRDNYFMVQALWVNINATKSITIGVDSNAKGGTFPAVTKSVSVTANTWTRCAFDNEVSLPLYNAYTPSLRYHLYYEPDGAASRQNRVWCCSKPAWLNHFDYGTFSLSALPDDDFLPTGLEGYGIGVEGYFTCNRLDWICALDQMDGRDVQDLIGRLIQWKSAIILITSILRSGKVNKYTMLNQEGLYRQRSALQKKYENAILWTVQNLPSGVTSCWGCEKSAPQVLSIIS